VITNLENIFLQNGPAKRFRQEVDLLGILKEMRLANFDVLEGTQM